MNPADLSSAYEKLKKDVEIGALMHEALLMGQLPKQVPGLSVAMSTTPSRIIDGDFFEFYSPTEDRLDIVLGDVMGKGIPAALMGTVLKTQLIRYAMPPAIPLHFDKVGGWHHEVLSIADILSRVQQAVNSELMKLEYFVSLIYGRFDIRQRLFSFVDCGFTKPIFFKSAVNKAEFYKGSNFPLGMVAEDHFQTVKIAFDVGDVFVFYSDGVTEARSKEGELFGAERVRALVEQFGHLNAEALQEQIKGAVQAFQADLDFQDDISLIVIKIEPLPSPKVQEFRFQAHLAELDTVRRTLHREALNFGATAKDADEVVLAINEVFCNIVEHGYQSQAGDILISLKADSSGLHIEVADQGESFNPLTLQQREERGERGYGWVIIQNLVDEAIYVPKLTASGWNHLHLHKKFYSGNAFMEIAHAIQGPHLIITPLGQNLDAQETPDFKEKVFKILDQSQAPYVIFDLKELQFIDSSGLGCFLSILRRLNAKGIRLRLTHLTDPVKSLFELVLMHKIFEITPDLEGALK